MERCEMRLKAETLQQVKELATEKECSQAQVIRELVSFGLGHTDSVYGKKEPLENPPEAPVIDLEAELEPLPSEPESEPENPLEKTIEDEHKSPEVETETLPEPEKDNPGKLFLMAKQRMKKQAGKEISESIVEG